MLFYLTTFAYMKRLMYIYIIIKANKYTNLTTTIMTLQEIKTAIENGQRVYWD